VEKLSVKRRKEIASLGGKSCLKKRGKEFYQQIGRKGGLTTSKKGSNYMKKLGEKGYKAMLSSMLNKLEKKTLDKKATKE
jgi:general stress protein YciG